MTFNSLHFVAFFAVVLSGVALLRKRLLARNTFLLLASWYFYGVWDWRFLALLLGTQAFDYTFARLIERYPLGSGKRKWFVVGSCAVNLTVLGFFKYCNFFIDSAVSLAQSLGYGIHRPELNVILPIGISFYTFQSMSYVIDVYRGHLKAERHPLHYALFVAFFPQLVAGPIERATHLLPQIKAPTNMNWDNLCHGFWLVGLGMFKKVVLADNISPVTAGVFDRPDVYPHAWESIVGIYAFAIQIYCDFSAYSDIARGAARMMGFDLMRNFDLPYFAVNPSDFWRRWHISLSTWLRDYLYIPLGGNRGGWFKTYRNLFLTMLLGGLWHGATWLFVLWGGVSWRDAVRAPRGQAVAGAVPGVPLASDGDGVDGAADRGVFSIHVRGMALVPRRHAGERQAPADAAGAESASPDFRASAAGESAAVRSDRGGAVHRAAGEIQLKRP